MSKETELFQFYVAQFRQGRPVRELTHGADPAAVSIYNLALRAGAEQLAENALQQQLGDTSVDRIVAYRSNYGYIRADGRPFLGRFDSNNNGRFDAGDRVRLSMPNDAAELGTSRTVVNTVADLMHQLHDGKPVQMGQISFDWKKGDHDARRSFAGERVKNLAALSGETLTLERPFLSRFMDVNWGSREEQYLADALHGTGALPRLQAPVTLPGQEPAPQPKAPAPQPKSVTARPAPAAPTRPTAGTAAAAPLAPAPATPSLARDDDALVQFALGKPAMIDADGKPVTNGNLFPGNHAINPTQYNPFNRMLQQGLKSIGASIMVDGKYGNETKQKVQDLQRAFHLQADGVAGFNAISALQFVEAKKLFGRSNADHVLSATERQGLNQELKDLVTLGEKETLPLSVRQELALNLLPAIRAALGPTQDSPLSDTLNRLEAMANGKPKATPRR